MAGSRVAYATLKGPSVVKEIVIGAVLELAAGSHWKMHHWNEQRKVRALYDMLDRGVLFIPCGCVFVSPWRGRVVPQMLVGFKLEVPSYVPD
ncbi:hypothetical protein QQ045_011989 [Rhodiola kirilowii]